MPGPAAPPTLANLSPASKPAPPARAAVPGDAAAPLGPGTSRTAGATPANLDASFTPGAPFAPAGVRFHPVSRKLVRARVLTAALALIVPFGGAVVAALLLSPWWWLAAAAMALIFGWELWLAPRQVRALGFAERQHDLMIRKGILFRSLVVVPYGRMQFVDVTAGPLDRLFGIAKVQLHTAASVTDAQIPGLPPAEAELLRDRLATRGEARLSGI